MGFCGCGLLLRKSCRTAAFVLKVRYETGLHYTSDRWGTPRLCLNFHARSYFVHACQCAERTGPPKILRFLLRKLQKLQYSQLYRLIAQTSTHLLGTTPVGLPVTPSERFGPVETSNGRIAVLARGPPENREVFCDFVASRGREGPPSILAILYVALNVRVILTYPCIFCMDNHQ